MKKISWKIATLSIVVMAFVMIIMREVLPMITDRPIGPINRGDWVFYTNAMFVFLTVIIFIIGLNLLVVGRIKKLNSKVNKIAKGNFEVRDEEQKYMQDEIGALDENIDKMAKTLHSNEYLNKDYARLMSHEIKTPLSAIIGYAELINAKTGKENKEYSKIIIDEAKRLSELSASLLHLSKLDAETIIAKNDLVIPSKQIRHLIALLQNQWEEKGIEIDADLSDFDILTNKEMIFQIWQNLIINAIKFSDNKKVIKIRLEKVDKVFIFSVTNFGKGIKPEEKDKVFDLFYKCRDNQSSNSNGIGLYLVKKIVIKLDGTISLTSDNDAGTTFTVELPLG